MHEAQAVLLRLLRVAPRPAWHSNPAPRRTDPPRTVLIPSSRPGICPGYLTKPGKSNKVTNSEERRIFAARLEGWQRVRAVHPSFETAAQEGGLLRMRSELFHTLYPPPLAGEGRVGTLSP